jgi:hypothetical protein
MFRKLAIYTVLSYLGVTILRSIPSGDQRDNNTRREGLDWFTVYREDKVRIYMYASHHIFKLPICTIQKQ